MKNNFYNILGKLSKLNILPYFKWDELSKEILKELLGDIPYFITNTGNIFIGENSCSDIKSGKICMQAHLDHPGGGLHFNREKDYMLCKFYGHRGSKYLVGRKFGAFINGYEDSVGELEVEHCKTSMNGYVTLFFKNNQDLISNYKDKNIAVHYNSKMKVENGKLKNWNLDDLINAALIIYYLKNNEFDGELYGLLTINEEVDHSGVYEFLNMIHNKELYFITMDTIYDGTETQSEFGIRTKQSNADLLKFFPQEIKSTMSEEFFAEIPFGRCEGVTFSEENRRGVSLFIKIKNFHNGLPFKKFGEEEIEIETLEKYNEFTKDLVNKIINCDSLFNQNNKMNDKKEKVKINIHNHSKSLKDKILSCENYGDYLTNVIPEFREVFTKYNLKMPNLDSNNFYRYKEVIKTKDLITLREEKVEEIVDVIINEVNNLFHFDVYKLFKGEVEIDIVQILLGNFNACNNYADKRVIVVSDDRVRNDDYKRLLTHELIHFITSKVWRALNIPKEMRTYYDEGLAIYLSAKISNLSLKDSLRFTDEKYLKCVEGEENLKNLFKDYCWGNLCEFHKGNIHEYFVDKSVPHPYYANNDCFSRYGYFLGAIETKRLIEEGKYHEKLSS